MTSRIPDAICWVGSARHRQPLDPTDEKKWQALARLGKPMFVIGFAQGLKPRHFMQGATFYLLPQLPAATLRYLTGLVCIPPLTLWLILWWHVEVIIAQGPLEGALAAFATQVAGAFGWPPTLIVESHGDFETSAALYRRSPLQKLRGAISSIVARFGLYHAHALRAISSATRAQLEVLAPGKPIQQFMAWTDSEAFLSVRRGQPPSQCHDIVFAGALNPVKGIHILIEAFALIHKKFPQARLRLIGSPGNQSYVRDLRAQVKRLGLSSRVEFVGEQSQADLAGSLARARVLVLPSLSEGLGRVIVEAMMCGTPVIASRVGGILDIVQEGTTGYLVPPGDATALAEALAEALSDPDIDGMGRRAREFAGEFFSTEAYVENHRRLIDAAISAARRPARSVPGSPASG